jgi:hypothetical protein
MSEPADSHHAEASVVAILEGGPADLPANLRRATVGRHDRKVKVRYLNGYEHFERADEDDGADAAEVRFRWMLRTRIAE